MSIWIMPFSLAAFAISTITYLMQVGDQLFKTLSVITVVITIASISVCGLYTFMWAFDHSLFTPRQKWGPASFMKLTHEAFRFAIPKLVIMLNGLDAASPAAVEKFVVELACFITAFDAHSQHEDLVLFPAARRFFPGLNPTIDSEHEKLHAELNKFQELITSFRSKNGSEAVSAGKALVAAMKKSFSPWGDAVLEHLRNEEATVTVAVRKYIPVEYQMDIVKKVFDLTSGEEWRKIMPYALNNLPVPAWKVRYLKTFIWANPQRAQEIGMYLYPTLDSVAWVFLAREMPEIIPRGLPGFTRMY
jgi:hemerythrin-like domain-containing protein